MGFIIEMQYKSTFESNQYNPLYINRRKNTIVSLRVEKISLKM